ncbi:MAG: ABC transporter ATP-binding protein [Acidimicrobiales bacterium]|nr:ABC transporter ATP-binding protein [Acidimicrobiales bacterium]MCB9395552.1 ABC transporter ATP-binding protein [Acidimicrobiaceae bacterium]
MPGEVHGILGENGAGKSTLMKILIGLVQPDEGSIELGGRDVVIHDPQTAAALGIGMVHQHLSLVEALTVWENVLLGDASRFDRSAARRQVMETAEHYGLEIDPDRRVGDLSAGLRQRVELIKCLRRDPKILILDEPTSVLTPGESEQLFTTLRDVVAAEQRAVALVSHKLAEILHATDRITIMRQGRVVERSRTVEATASSLATAMVGRHVNLRSSAAALGVTDLVDDERLRAEREAAAAAAAVAARPVVLDIDRARVVHDGVAVLDDLSIQVRAGEIVGVAGVEGNGQRELGDLLSSLVTLDSGSVVVNGRSARTGRAGCMAELGIGVIPEDRHDSGCVLDLSVAENLVLDRIGSVARLGLVDRKRMRARALELMREFDIQAAGPDAPFGSLSGGNQQRVVLARELGHDPTVLVAAQPTRGLDVGAIEYMSGRLRAAADSGIAVLLVSTELEEILELSDRIVVMSRGRVIGELDRAEATSERLGLLLGGVGDDHDRSRGDAA